MKFRRLNDFHENEYQRKKRNSHEKKKMFWFECHHLDNLHELMYNVKNNFITKKPKNQTKNQVTK